MRLFKHILWFRAVRRPYWAPYQWRLSLILLVVLCISVEPIAGGCRTASPGLLRYQQVGWQAPASVTIAAPQPSINLLQSAATASETTAPASSCSSIVGRTPLGATAPLSFLDKLLAAGLALAGAILVRRIRFDALLRPPQIRYPPPTPPPIATLG